MPKEDETELEDYNDRLEDVEIDEISDVDADYEEDLDAEESFAEEKAASEFDDD